MVNAEKEGVMELYTKDSNGKLVRVKLNIVDVANKVLIFEMGTKSKTPCMEDVAEFGEAIRNAIPKESEVIIVPHGYAKLSAVYQKYLIK